VRAWRTTTLVVALAAGCGAPPVADDAGLVSDAGAELRPDASAPPDAGLPPSDAGTKEDDPWADRVVRFDPGPGAGFGQDRFPEVVLGPPRGGGEAEGSLDVLSLGRLGVIVLEFTDLVAIDGPGVDLLVFENGFSGFFETGVVAVSDDGETWHEFPCAAPVDGGVEGCAGTRPVFAYPERGISGTDPAVAGGDGFDLADVGLARARFVRVTDSGANRFYGGPAGGFDLDAVSVVNTARLDGGAP
jgi:hypothetical protein